MLALAVGACAFNVPSMPRAVANAPRSSAPVAALEAITPETAAYIAGGVIVLGGAAFAYQKEGEKAKEMRENSPSVVGSKPAPKAAAKPATAKPINSKDWPALGGSGAAHPMAGPWPKAPKRELWVPPPGWKPPTKPVQSWYDNGLRLTPPAPPAPPPAPPAPEKKKDFFSSFMGAHPHAAHHTAPNIPRATSEYPTLSSRSHPHPSRAHHARSTLLQAA